MTDDDPMIAYDGAVLQSGVVPQQRFDFKFFSRQKSSRFAGPHTGDYESVWVIIRVVTIHIW